MNEAKINVLQARKCLAKGLHFFGPDISKIVDKTIRSSIETSLDAWELLAELFEDSKKAEQEITAFLLMATEFNLECQVVKFEGEEIMSATYLKFSVTDDTFYYFSLRKALKGFLLGKEG